MLVYVSNSDKVGVFSKRKHGCIYIFAKPQKCIYTVYIYIYIYTHTLGLGTVHILTDTVPEVPSSVLFSSGTLLSL